MRYPNRIKEIREARDFTQDKLAAAVHTSRGQIFQLEKGLRKLSHDWMVRLAEALGCEPGDFIRPSAPPKVPVVGFVGAGAEIYGIDDYAKGAGHDEVDVPPGVDPRHIVAVAARA